MGQIYVNGMIKHLSLPQTAGMAMVHTTTRANSNAILESRPSRIYEAATIAPAPAPSPASAPISVNSTSPPHFRPASPSHQPKTSPFKPIPSWIVPPRVLLVEDDPLCRMLSSKILAVFGCVIHVAVDGLAAVVKMNLEKYDLVLMVCKPSVLCYYPSSSVY